MAASDPPAGQELLAGDPKQYGSATDPLIGKRPGGVVLFGGGLALYRGGHVVRALGASGDTSCADHNIAWRLRQKLGFDKVPDGPSPAHNDAIVYDVGSNGQSLSGWGHPECGHDAPQVAMKIGAGSPWPRSPCTRRLNPDNRDRRRTARPCRISSAETERGGTGPHHRACALVKSGGAVPFDGPCDGKLVTKMLPRVMPSIKPLAQASSCTRSWFFRA